MFSGNSSSWPFPVALVLVPVLDPTAGVTEEIPEAEAVRDILGVGRGVEMEG